MPLDSTYGIPVKLKVTSGEVDRPKLVNAEKEYRKRIAALEAENARLKAIVDQVDDELVVNWITVIDGNYRKALHDLVMYQVGINKYFDDEKQREKV